jgi:hypothetical protein
LTAACFDRRFFHAAILDSRTLSENKDMKIAYALKKNELLHKEQPGVIVEVGV